MDHNIWTSKKKWIREFIYGRMDVHDKQHSGWPLVSAETIAKVEQEQEMLEDDDDNNNNNNNNDDDDDNNNNNK